MAKAKTSTKKTSIKSSVPKIASIGKKMSIGDLKNKVVNPANRKPILIALGVVVFVVLLYLGRGLFIAATVNGQPISRLAVINELEKQSGQPVLDSLITRILVQQAAKEKKIEISNDEIQAEIDRITAEFKEQGQDLNALLEAQGLSQEKFRDEVKIQLIVTKLLGDEAKVTDEEFNEFMVQNPDLFTEDENQEEAKSSLRKQLEQQKLAQKYQEWMTNIRSEAKINSFVDY